MNSELYMRRCLQLAALGGGYVAPNPMVGAVLVVDNQIIGEGYHREYGAPHAEPNAIKNAVETHNNAILHNATLYVNLEPCSHYGKTPPCADLIIENGIRKVVIGTTDPNEKVAGRGIEKMQNAGIEVVTCVLKNECRELNKRFFTFHEKKRPYILLKWAQTSDGFIDCLRSDNSQSPLEISNRLTKMLTHKIRTENQAIMVGTNTALLDNPHLTARHWAGQNPVRIVLDKDDKIPSDFRIFDKSAQTIVIKEKNVNRIIQEIYKKNIHSVIVEGGAKTLNLFLAQNLWDEAQVEFSPKKIGTGIAAPKMQTIPVQAEIFDENKIFYYKNCY